MSKNVSFVKTAEEIAALRQAGIGNNYDWYLDQEKVQFAWMIDQKVYEKLLPPPLEPVAPVVVGFVAHFDRPAANLYPYREGMLSVLAKYNGVTGTYCLAMPIEGHEMGIFLGRELFNYPKKVAKIDMQRRGDECCLSIERNGVRFFELKGQIGNVNDPGLYSQFFKEPVINEITTTTTFLIDYQIKVSDDTIPCVQSWKFDDVHLVGQKNLSKVITNEKMSIDVTLRESEDDPWAELAPVKMLGAVWSNYELSMLGSKSLKAYSAEEVKSLEPYLFNRYDTMLFGKHHASY